MSQTHGQHPQLPKLALRFLSHIHNASAAAKENQWADCRRQLRAAADLHRNFAEEIDWQLDYLEHGDPTP